MQIFEIARRPREAVPEIPEQQKSQLTALAALKAELIQKTSVYSDAHPAVTALKKRIAARSTKTLNVNFFVLTGTAASTPKPMTL